MDRSLKATNLSMLLQGKQGYISQGYKDIKATGGGVGQKAIKATGRDVGIGLPRKKHLLNNQIMMIVEPQSVLYLLLHL